MALVVFTGGARSGKSAAAQELARLRSLDGVHVTVAVFGDPSEDAEMEGRIAHHQASRPDGFTTLEAVDSCSWLGAVSDDELLVVDCLGTLVSRVMSELPSQAATEVVEQAVRDVVARIQGRRGDTIVVTNEVGHGVVPSYASGRVFRDVLGRANRALVATADAAYLVVCGRLFDLMDRPVMPSWPAD